MCITLPTSPSSSSSLSSSLSPSPSPLPSLSPPPIPSSSSSSFFYKCFICSYIYTLQAAAMQFMYKIFLNVYNSSYKPSIILTTSSSPPCTYTTHTNSNKFLKEITFLYKCLIHNPLKQLKH
jgi:hypothetical protein